MLVKAWVRFDEMSVECICTEVKKKDCKHNYECDEYIVKFTAIPKSEKIFDNNIKKLTAETNKFKKEVDNLNKLSKIFLKK